MSLITFLGCAAIGTAIAGITIAHDELSPDDLERYVSKNTKVFSTQINNDRLLKKSLNELGLITTSNDNNLKSMTSKGDIIFIKNNQNNYDILFNGNFSNAEINSFYDELFDYYTSFVQEETYEKVLNDIQTAGYQLESEEVREDNSIVLTINTWN